MHIGILGTGRMGVRLAMMFADAGHEITLGSPRPESRHPAGSQSQTQ